MKIVVFKGFAPISFSGSWGDFVLQGNGLINRVDPELWDAVYKEYKNSIDGFVKSGVMEFSNSNDKKTKQDSDVAFEAGQDIKEKQDKAHKATGIKVKKREV